MAHRVAALLVCLAVVAVACGDGTPTPGPTGSASEPIPTALPTPGLTLVPTDPGTTPAPTPPGQTDTPWGRIWDGLPAGFPAWPGAAPTETGAGPASALLDAGPADAHEVASYYESALGVAGYATVSMDGPGEEGSWEVNAAAGEAGCHVLVTVAPLGGSTIVTVLFGADCPFD